MLFTPHTSHLTPHASHITHQASHVTRHTPHPRDFDNFIKAAEKIPQILSFFDMHSDYDNADVIHDRLQRSLKRAITECEEDIAAVLKKAFAKSRQGPQLLQQYLEAPWPFEFTF